MARNGRTDESAFNKLKFNKLDWKTQRESANNQIIKEKAERLKALSALIDADTIKIEETKTATRSKSTVQYSGRPEYFINSLNANK